MKTTAKDEVRTLLEKLPDDASLNETTLGIELGKPATNRGRTCEGLALCGSVDTRCPDLFLISHKDHRLFIHGKTWIRIRSGG